MTHPILFPFAETWWIYASFTALVALLLAIDLGVFHRQAKPVSFREATLWSAGWIVLALAFNAALYFYASSALAADPRLQAIPGFDSNAASRQVALEFLAGYLIERALSLDNIFVFLVVFSYFNIPAVHQHRVLFYGIVGAFVFRGAFVAVGSALLQFEWMILLMGALLLATGAKMLFAGDKPQDLDNAWWMRLLRRWLPITGRLHGSRFFVRAPALMATPLFLSLAALEMLDIVFAIDSVPAIFAVTKEPLIVFTSNIFAILGLRAMYFMVSGAVGRFHLLRYGLAAVLMFVGLKMVWLNEWYGGKFPIVYSLAIIVALIAIPVVLSMWMPKPDALTDSAGLVAAGGTARHPLSQA